MKRIFGIVAILLMASGIATAAEYWHFGAGARVTGVMPGDDYSNALGSGLLLTFGNPDSRFTTQFDLDVWDVKYNKDDSLIETQPLGDTVITYKKRDFEYYGLGIGAFEKYRFYDISANFSSYVIGGLGGYFLNRKRETRDDTGALIVKSIDGMQSLFQMAGGIGFEGKFNQHLMGFIEGRYVAFLNGDKAYKNLMKGYLGIRYVF